MSPVFALLGAGEFQPWSAEVDRWVLERATGDGSVLILPTAAAPEGDAVFDEWAQMGRAHFDELGVVSRVVPLKTREDAERPEIVRRLEGASAVYFSGGNPASLADVLEGSAFWNEMRAQLDRGMGYIGCSAGVAPLGDNAPDITVGELSEAMFERRGLRLFPGWNFGLHWNKLDEYMPGLRDFICGRIPPGSRMLAIDEDTAAVGDGTTWTVIGAATVSLLENDAWRTFRPGESFSASLLETTNA
jgi:cyanophycinase